MTSNPTSATPATTTRPYPRSPKASGSSACAAASSSNHATTPSSYADTRACARLVNYARQLAAGRTPLDAIGEAGYETALADEPEGMIRSGGYVLDTLKAAVWCLVTTDDYAGCALKAVNLGADTDTTAAVAGGLAGIVYGIDSIPAEWIAKLRGKDVIDACLFA